MSERGTPDGTFIADEDIVVILPKPEFHKVSVEPKVFDEFSESNRLPSQNPHSIFGLSLVEKAEYAKRRGALFAHHKEIKMPSVEVNSQVDSAKRLVVEQTKSMQEEFGVLAQNEPEVLEDLLLEYFSTKSRLGDLEKKLGLDDSFDFISDGMSSEESERLLNLVIFSSGSRNFNSRVRIIILKIIGGYKKGNYRLPDRQLIEMLTIHRDKVLMKAEKLEKDFPEFKKRVLDLLDKAIERGELPISKEYVAARLDKIDCTIIDSLTANLEDRGGSYYGGKHTISLSSGVPNDLKFKVFVHEIVHALSGQIRQEGSETDALDPDIIWRGVEKVGNRFNHFAKDFSIYDVDDERAQTHRPNFRWLNEAITEDITGQLVGKAVSYKKERELLALIVQYGIPTEVLRLAYFDNHDIEKKAGHHLLKTKELFDATNKKFHTGFLVDLDKYIFQGGQEAYKNNLAAVVDKWRELGNGFSEFLADWSKSFKANKKTKT